MAAYAELLDQLDATGVAPRRVYHASTSCGTHAGLALGHALAQRGPQPLCIDVGRIVEDPQAVATWLAHEASGLLGAEPALGASDADLDFSQLGGGYGAFTRLGIDAIRLVAQTEGVVLDPVYSGKAMAGLIADARAGRVNSPVVFWHTGGGPSLFAAGWGQQLLA